MGVPLQITFRDIEPSAAIEAKIRDRFARLTRRSARIESCHVVVEAPHRHHKKGFGFSVRVQVAVPGDDIIVVREHAGHHSQADLYSAVREAFEAATRQLENHPMLRAYGT